MGNFLIKIYKINKSAICAIIMYDVTNKESFSDLVKWIEEVKSNGNDKMLCLLVGNKTDLSHKFIIYI